MRKYWIDLLKDNDNLNVLNPHAGDNMIIERGRFFFKEIFAI